MAGARLSAFRGGGGILRDVDGTIVSLKFADTFPGFGPSKSGFKSLYAIIGVVVDGAEAVQEQPLFVGGADDFEVSEDGMELLNGNMSKGSGWFTFLSSLVTAGFDETALPEDRADFSGIVGARARFNWQKNEKTTQKYGAKEGKRVDPKTGKPVTYDREDLIVTAYYGQASVAVKSGKPGAKPAAAKVAGAKTATKPAATVDVAALATENIIAALKAEKTGELSKQKLSVKLLNLLGASNPSLVAVRTWAQDDANLGGIDGVIYDPTTQKTSLDV